MTAKRTADGLGHPRRWAWSGLAVVLSSALALRLWGIGQGLPYVYNIDERDHFARRAIAMFGDSLNPHYFANPPAFTYLLHLVFAVWFGGKSGVAHAYALHPDDVYIVARVTAAALGTAAVWMLYLVGSRLFGCGVGLLAAALEAVAFLPVFYAHLALNDVPTLAPLTLSLLGTAGVLRKGRLVDYLVAGVGLGLACATKYTAGIVLLPLLAAIAAQYLDRAPGGAPEARRPAFGPRILPGIAIAGAGALVAFLIADPYAVLDFHSFHSELARQSALSGEAQGKLGAPKQGGVVYYLWSLTWGLGWVPALAALGGALTVWRAERSRIGRRLGWLLVPAPVLFLVFMGLEGRYFGRWLLPIFPIVCLLAAFFALQAAGVLARQLPRATGDRPARDLRVVLVAVAVVALCGQGAVYSIHSGLLLSRADTRNLTRAWMVAHVPVGTQIVVEPVAPDGWVRDIGRPPPGTGGGPRWLKYASLVSVISAAGAVDPSAVKVVGIEDYVRTLSPALIPNYEREGYCWVISGSTQSGRAFADPRAAPYAIAYYRALAREGEVAYRVSPYSRGEGPVAFNFDWSFDYYPLAYHRPGPEMTVYRLRGGRCGR
jgi:4-amino-4-deoxy-L-arabinose transferase-like glycosyltransferase